MSNVKHALVDLSFTQLLCMIIQHTGFSSCTALSELSTINFIIA